MGRQWLGWCQAAGRYRASLVYDMGILIAETFSYKNGYKLVVQVQIEDRKATTVERADKLTRLLIGRL